MPVCDGFIGSYYAASQVSAVGVKTNLTIAVTIALVLPLRRHNPKKISVPVANFPQCTIPHDYRADQLTEISISR